MPYKYFLLAPTAEVWRLFAKDKNVSMNDVCFLPRDANRLSEHLRGRHGIILYKHKEWDWNLESSMVIAMNRMLHSLVHMGTINEIIYI